ncbi:MAG: RDD family protein, partial [Methylococcales bacterium]|nr:RDD family protein [Methylococcales bacterium]
SVVERRYSPEKRTRPITMLGKTTTLEIRTPEGVSFRVPIASPFSRCLALSIDIAVISALTLILIYVINILASMAVAIPGIGKVLKDFSSASMIIVQFVVITFYGMITEWLWRGQTLGKRLMKLRVIDERGLPLAVKQIIIRNLFRNLDILPSMFYLIGGVSCLFTKRCQRIGDIAAGTLVIRESEVEKPAINELISSSENSFSSHPHLEARLRQKTTPDEARVALDALTRRDELTPDDGLRVFSKIADYFREVAEFPDEITMGLSDEQYVRNVVDTLFRRASS